MKNKILLILNCVKNLLCNILVCLLNMFIWRSPKIWIIGSWMGGKFSDNSRFLFDYLTSNKEKYNIEKVFWVTRNKDIFYLMQENGFKNVLLCNTIKSFYYHLKAGVHVICNSNGSTYKGDISTLLSFGAKKIQLWHGVGIKACCKLCVQRANGLRGRIIDLINYFSKPGNWANCYFLTTSKENSRVARLDFGIKRDRIIQACYPRLLGCSFYFDNEKETIDIIKNLKINHRIILYLPTFRKDISKYYSPEEISGFETFLINNNIIWIQKSHSVDNQILFNKKINNLINLPSEFDINILYKFVDMVITDYSSASSDAIFNNIITLEYCPDFECYKNNDRGFVNDYMKYHINPPVLDSNELFDEILHSFEKGLDIKNKEVCEFLFENYQGSMDDVMRSILYKINIRSKKKF